MKNRFLEKILDILIVLCGIVSLVLLSGCFSDSVNFNNYARIFTIYTIIAVLYYLLECVYIWNRKHGVFFSLVKYIVVTGITFCAIFTLVFLQPFYKNATGSLMIGYICMHDVLPILVVLEYLVSHKGHFNRKFIITHMVLFVVYGIIALLCGQYAGMGYPYAFLDPEQLGYDIVLKECVLIVVVMFVYGNLVLAFDKKYKKVKKNNGKRNR